jgi:redox-sensitive bicupin YhaK (pirin superfamily)
MSEPFFGPHPHAGFSVTTSMFEDSRGAFVNRDSAGDHSRIAPGALHWTQAGSGIQHEEVPERPGTPTHGLQIWVDHAAADRLAPPAAFHVEAEDVPERLGDGARARVLVSASGDVRAPFDPIPPITLLDLHLQPGARFTEAAPAEHLALLLVVAGDVTPGDGEPLAAHDAAVLEADGNEVELRAGPLGAQVLVGHGPRLGGPTLFGGPFVMSTEAQLEDARRRFARGEMGRLDPSS